MDQVAYCAETSFGRYLADLQMRVFSARSGNVGAYSSGTAGAIIDTSLVVEAAGIEVSLSNGVGGSTGHGCTRSER